MGHSVKHDKALKFYDQKARLDLLSTLAIEEMCQVLAYGCRKYDADNWRLGMCWRRLLRAAIGHIFAFMRGQDLDPETGRSHVAHAMCCLMFVLEYWITQGGSDDRWDELRKMPCSPRVYNASRKVRHKKQNKEVKRAKQTIQISQAKRPRNRKS